MVWTPEKIAALDTDQIKNLRKIAEGRDATVVELCESELRSRRSKKLAHPGVSHSSGEVVIGFHFVCDRGRGVTKESERTVWTGTWVVDKMHAEKAAKNGAYVALHAAKSEPSYLQGTVIDWRVNKRERQYAEGQPAKSDTGIDFLIEITNMAYQWVGDGSGEKGYAWAKITPNT
jgi:hypothetical protein